MSCCYDNGCKMAATVGPNTMTHVPLLMSNQPEPKSKQLLRRPRPKPKPVEVVEDTPRSERSSLHIEEEYARLSPVPSVVPSLASPAPSEYYPSSGKSGSRSKTKSRSRSSRLLASSYRTHPQTPHFVSQDRRYILDSREASTAQHSIVQGRSLVKPYKPRGPDALPARAPKRHPALQYDSNLFVDFSNDERYTQPPEFTLQHFLIHMSEVEKIPMDEVKETMYSRHNYKRLTKLLMEKLNPRQTQINTVRVEPPESDLPEPTPRVPQRQLLLEMASIIKEQMKSLLNTNVKTVIKPLKKYTPGTGVEGNGPHTEILLYEDDSEVRKSRERELKLDTELPARDAIFHAGVTRYFQGTGRSRSPFSQFDEGFITPSELAILDCLMNGGTSLSLKAHFISQLPDLGPLLTTVTYLNLSFNDLRVFPVEIFDLKQLETLKLRNNPITEIPPDICKLAKLKVLVISFNLLSQVPLSLFSLSGLYHLDISYNRLSFVPNEIRRLKNLRELMVEGNQLAAMPSGALKLKNLKHLTVRNNFMHPLFWKENTRNQPQRLTDLACLAFMNAGLHRRAYHLTETVARLLQPTGQCDCCNGPLYGPGLRLIRPASKIFGIKNLPFLFVSCSPYCANMFLKSTDSISELIYGSDQEQEES
ncbi:leucine-rich repeat-containing protein 63 [Lingula anatina]|uniref:Leucine-rich repeat-containing protein 63 n=1 Tax=Lingula anatina TaxID=7574 RepID=A0A2R2MK59_LINAN|nr:leucine-rich repeat-containing protein 63 [Lingula anatina]|eukprot:XP_023930593.1 leucine-rich repeat-containing protein 63 [Lingula anatina]